MSDSRAQAGELSGKTVLVTGSSRGIGRAIALELGRMGANVCINYLSNTEQAQAVVELLRTECGTQAIAIAADVSKGEEVERLFREVQQSFGPIQILVNNAGVTRDNLVLRLSESDWDNVLDTNLKSAYLCSKAAIRMMLRAQEGVIINIASVVALIGNPGQANYTAAKGGLIALSKTLETDMTSSLTQEARKALAQRITLGYLGKPEDIAAAVGFLCSPRARYITGQVWSVDGGLSL
jgi:3-oxoacyl-[acyl-carrier protein] reductase